MEEKIKFLVEETPFFRRKLLVKEGFIENWQICRTFGVVGLHECVETLVKFENSNAQYGKDDFANNVGLEVMDFIENRVNAFRK